MSKISKILLVLIISFSFINFVFAENETVPNTANTTNTTQNATQTNTNANNQTNTQNTVQTNNINTNNSSNTQSSSNLQSPSQTTTISSVDSSYIDSDFIFVLDILLITVGVIIILFAIAILMRLK